MTPEEIRQFMRSLRDLVREVIEQRERPQPRPFADHSALTVGTTKLPITAVPHAGEAPVADTG